MMFSAAQDFDGKVARTNTRPLASGALSMSQAFGFLVAQLSVGLGVLLQVLLLLMLCVPMFWCLVLMHAVQLNWYSIQLGAASLGLVIAYPLMKRFTNWPQLVLGLTFNWGSLLGYAAVTNGLDYSIVLPLYAGGVAWTLVYDTLYAHQDKQDDAQLGLKSTALLFGDNTKPILTAFASACIGGIVLAGVAKGALVCSLTLLTHPSDCSSGLHWPFYCGTAASAAHIAWQIKTADLSDRYIVRLYIFGMYLTMTLCLSQTELDKSVCVESVVRGDCICWYSWG